MRKSVIADVAVRSARISGKTLWTFVRLRDDEGRVGWGEATLQDRAADVHAHVERHAGGWTGRAVEAPREPVASGGDLAEAAALCALDQAMWDLAGQAQDAPVAALMGKPGAGPVPLYANINRGIEDRSPEGFAARAREVASRGFAAVKVAPFDGVAAAALGTPAGRELLERGLARVLAVREAIGPGCSLMVDCHWRLSEAAADEVLARLAPAKLYWLECPLPEDASTLDALKRLRARANAQGVRLAGCESMTGLAAFRTFLDAGAYDAIMPDAAAAGGLAQLLRIGDEAQRRGVLCSPHNPTGPIAHLASVHVAAALAACPFLELQYGESAHFFDIVSGALPDPTHGASEVPRAPGLGAALDEAALAALAVDPPRAGPTMA